MRMELFSRIKSYLSVLTLILSVLGVITFTLFIFEEAIQMVTFGTWPAQYSKDWDLVMEGCDTIESINRGMKIVNYSVGWLQPFAFFSYRAYGRATDYYVEGLRRKVFANAPECFLGRRIKLVFVPSKIEVVESGVRLVNGNVFVLADSAPETGKVLVSGVVVRQGDLLQIKADSIRAVPK